MEVLTDSKSSTPVLLPNAELMTLLAKDVKANKKRMDYEINKQKKKDRKNGSDRKVKNRFEHRDWIQEHVLEYLKGTPCVNIPKSKLKELKTKCMSKGTSSCASTKKKRRTALSDSSSPQRKQSPGYGLTEAETLQVLNFMPQEPVEIHLMVDDLHDRMSETKQEEFLGMIRSYNKAVETPTNAKKANLPAAEEVVDDSIEMLEQAGNQALNEDGDTDMKVKEEI
uniref:DNA-directed RNA polymerase III subunit RPC9 n=1 Tax=Pseudo-nitzschia delicatissima TaxID=44447 RepID=A0A7S0Y7Q5_9STRA|mmetsp:Transcript_2392/g.5065  ORF Transcript_2392/g.5065 Transcript_2392/m.5065 type:complete len:225 (+) Transcript_2392:33-707(+)|eukprot:CAMPEP_0197267070 /NCGR_PEP_ID=MMETSP1432-20130617/3382_1 /TAXON_ID=44447 /ORGANISM="Pseudo-nitzschia delicatissima, Strain UNC1205" /LENGTH=224 /DNA_ID=CAMNT_0042731999 /DNA_START=28 /DNA_END=702 /DNA_ORIENTATION=-